MAVSSSDSRPNPLPCLTARVAGIIFLMTVVHGGVGSLPECRADSDGDTTAIQLGRILERRKVLMEKLDAQRALQTEQQATAARRREDARAEDESRSAEFQRLIEGDRQRDRDRDRIFGDIGAP